MIYQEVRWIGCWSGLGFAKAYGGLAPQSHLQYIAFCSEILDVVTTDLLSN